VSIGLDDGSSISYPNNAADPMSWGTPTGAADDPVTAFSGTRVLGNDLGSGSDGAHEPTASTWARRFAECGDGSLGAGEVCDDGNTVVVRRWPGPLRPGATTTTRWLAAAATPRSRARR
jgi:hypothetical protein